MYKDRKQDAIPIVIKTHEQDPREQEQHVEILPLKQKDMIYFIQRNCDVCSSDKT